MNTESLDKWEGAAWDLPGPIPGLRAPFAVLSGEALDCARFAQRNWQPQLDGKGRELLPGLISAVGTGQFTDTIVADLLELMQALQIAESRYALLVDASDAAPVDRARHSLGEMKEVLQWYFDEGVTDESDAQLLALAKKHEQLTSHDALAAALYDYALLAERHQDAIDGVGGFNSEVIEESRKLADALRERSAGPPSFEPPAGTQRALDLRNRIGLLLYDRMHRVRTAARFVFRGHPEIIRRATSAYGRRQRAAQRRARAERGAAEAPTVEVPAVPAPEAPAQ